MRTLATRVLVAAAASCLARCAPPPSDPPASIASSPSPTPTDGGTPPPGDDDTSTAASVSSSSSGSAVVPGGEPRPPFVVGGSSSGAASASSASSSSSSSSASSASAAASSSGATSSSSGVVLLARCGDGRVDVGEECDPPDGTACNYLCQDRDARETDCEDLEDNDLDGLVDCADADACQGTPACQAGTSPTGRACVANNQCRAEGGDPLCITEFQLGWPGGYCSEHCTSDDDCAAGICSPRPGSVGNLCLLTCDADTDCRAGYSCDRLPDGRRACIPRCTDDTQCMLSGHCIKERGVCGALAVCGNGAVEPGEQCDPPDGVTCGTNCRLRETSCEDLRDDDGDGLYDCRDNASCKGRPACEPGNRATGEPCTRTAGCSAALGNDPLCLTERVVGFPGGMCSEYCNVDEGGCANGTTCLDIGLGPRNGVCLPRCTDNADCRAGYTCGVHDGAQVCLPACTDHAQCGLTAHCDLAAGRCITAPGCGNGRVDPGEACEPPGSGVCNEQCQVRVGVCGNGLVETGESCDPPNGSTCNATCQGVELACADLYDDDNDGLLDCADPDCHDGREVCNEGAGRVGSACTAANDCSATDGDPACLWNLNGLKWGGYCSELCNLQAQDCGAGAFCQPALGRDDVGLCIRSCTGDADCREGTRCLSAGTGRRGCFATMSAPVPQEVDCNDLRDDNHNGLYDCQDPDRTCRGDFSCTPGVTELGGECTRTRDCNAQDGDPFCIHEKGFGHPQGSCSEYCSVSAQDCGTRGVCVAVEGVSNDVGLCMAACSGDTQCRTGYRCGDAGYCVPACTSDAQCTGKGVCNFTSGLCVPATRCGDLVVEAFEECDPPGVGNCNARCQLLPTCGDGRLDAGEQCEPPGVAGCQADCTVVPGWTCHPANYGAADGCDCGCGVVDPDCTATTLDACDICHNGCSAEECAGNTELSTTDNAQCI
ncbi:MAG: hypothetical protein AB2A00_22350 [Myxococcota bacterium]